VAVLVASREHQVRVDLRFLEVVDEEFMTLLLMQENMVPAAAVAVQIRRNGGAGGDGLSLCIWEFS
jgi:hypothetical protein